MSGEGQTTGDDFAKAILEAEGATSNNIVWLAADTGGRPLIARRVIPISAEEFRSPAHRPAYSVLSNTRLFQTFGVALPDWRTQLQRCFISDSIAANRGTD